MPGACSIHIYAGEGRLESIHWLRYGNGRRVSSEMRGGIDAATLRPFALHYMGVPVFHPLSILGDETVHLAHGAGRANCVRPWSPGVSLH